MYCPEYICTASEGLLSISWSQSGSVEDSPTGKVSFYDHRGAEVVQLSLTKRNYGLYYSCITSVGVDSKACLDPLVIILNVCVFSHCNDFDDDELSLDLDDDSRVCSSSTVQPDVTPKAKQLEADLWQAWLGHISNWQLKVLPLSANGLPANFQPHPFAFYDHYRQARVRKRRAILEASILLVPMVVHSGGIWTLVS